MAFVYNLLKPILPWKHISSLHNIEIKNFFYMYPNTIVGGFRLFPMTMFFSKTKDLIITNLHIT